MLNYFFAVVFTFEALIKIIALGKNYFKNNWNTFDLIVVIISDVGIVLELSGSFDGGSKTTLIRAFRVIRIFRLI